MKSQNHTYQLMTAFAIVSLLLLVPFPIVGQSEHKFSEWASASSKAESEKTDKSANKNASSEDGLEELSALLREHEQLGDDGFEDAVKQISEIEGALELSDLAIH
jgi:hypothetical protein